ncbi:hypothetical protein JCM5296_004868 [Sporobolomyces johnsonii]
MLYASVLLALATFAAAGPLDRRQLQLNESAYPVSGTKGPTPKAEWVTTYNAAVAAGKIPDFPPSVLSSSGMPTYPSTVNTSSICAWSLTTCIAPTDIAASPNGAWGVAFDDGPLPPSPALYTFLQQNNQSATHFFIGGNILDNPTIFQQAVQTGGHIAVHTFSHPYMTTLTDLEVVGELGWTAQIMLDMTGWLPAYWRPPYGDIDNRIRAIAQQVFGLTAVIWNQDSNDWCLNDQGGTDCVGEGPANEAALQTELIGFQDGVQTPGLIVLEHELTNYSVEGFMSTYTNLKSKGWNAKNIPLLFSSPWYQNAATNAGPVNASAQVGTGFYNVSAPQPSHIVAPNSATMRLPTPTSFGETVTATALQHAASATHKKSTGPVPPSAYPVSGTIGPSPKAEWVTVYEAAKAAGKIPSISPSTLSSSGMPTYPSSVNTSAICAWSLTTCIGPHDIGAGPNGAWGVAFDDGPLLPSPRLYDFLQQNNQSATHFFIGSNILDNPTIFEQAVQSGGHIAVHTFSHQYTTTLNDSAVLGELGWTAQLILDKTGWLPAFWRPPYGDVDNRIRAIAEEVFGLKTVIWNQDSNDWCLNDQGGSDCGEDGPADEAALQTELTGFQDGVQTPGLIVLEHELTNYSVEGFMSTYTNLKSKGWNAENIPDLFKIPWYQNAVENGAEVNTSAHVGQGFFNVSAPPPMLHVSTATSTATSPGQTATAYSAGATLGEEHSRASRNIDSPLAGRSLASFFLVTLVALTGSATLFTG